MGIKTNITLYTEGTPNGLKPTILLAELGLEYKLVPINIFTQENKELWFVKINPNGRIPALTDVNKNGKEVRTFESGTILEYLVTQYDKDHKVSYPHNSPEYWETVSWLTWQMAGVGPMQGQANHFARPVVYRILDTHLAASPSGYITGDRVTIADIAIWPWVGAYTSLTRLVPPSPEYSGLSSIDEFPHVKKWLYTLLVRPGFEEGRNAPGPHRYLKMNEMSEEELNSIAASLGTWVLDAMKRDTEA
ncbi:thioredoxin-like protein [Ilyonectria sp. MPI-CAGE-AT-0026]|nr:thioredoxin-like protein [Ilyonectria sp. MPI-CAGE-AT-0026]